jgi:hypothetical protein
MGIGKLKLAWNGILELGLAALGVRRGGLGLGLGVGLLLGFLNRPEVWIWVD